MGLHALAPTRAWHRPPSRPPLRGTCRWARFLISLGALLAAPRPACLQSRSEPSGAFEGCLEAAALVATHVGDRALHRALACEKGSVRGQVSRGDAEGRAR